MSRPYATDEQYERWFMAECCRCGQRRHKAGTWPDGYVCRTCSDHAVRTRGTCPGCGQDRALPGLHPVDGSGIYTTCAGFSQTFGCSRCGFEGKLLGGRLCERCTLTDRLTALLDDGTGLVRQTLLPLLDMLVAMDEPRSGLAWLAMRRDHPGNASQMLRRTRTATSDPRRLPRTPALAGSSSPGRTPDGQRHPPRRRQGHLLLPAMAAWPPGRHHRSRAPRDDQALRDLARLEVSTRKGITVQVMPLDCGGHPSLAGMFSIFSLPSPWPTVVNLENLRGGTFVEGTNDVTIFEEALDQIVATAQSPDESRETIKKIMEEKHS
ncbi:Scr1 family TA system antitoxin-like transcriptional regulator [Streptomyces sp. PanSC19]|uniref:Scr1 family TA system antitoxin-like transcriptional regulator n=1 Tax=Streptomyces sp. PanSC19 TaxID=1520455 RepID=UPI00160A99C8|nr:Scr1 family TA system antitoxin-like transcriptional regulator [Streptomyces sp. PanSC19]